MYMQASFKNAQRLHISYRGGPGHVGSPSFLWHRVTLLNTCSCSATSTTLCFAKRTTLCFCTAFRDILSLHIAHAFRFAWFAYHHLQNPWFSLRHGQYTLIFRFYSFFFSHGYTDYLSIHSESSGRANPVIIALNHCFPAEVFTQLTSQVQRMTCLLLLHTT